MDTDAKKREKVGFREHCKVGGSRKIAKELLLQAAYCGVGFLLGRAALPLGITPLGLAFLATSDKYLIASLLGNLASVFSGESDVFPTVLGLLLVASMRFLHLRKTKREEKMPRHAVWNKETVFCALLAAFGWLFADFATLLAGGFRFYDTAGLFFGVAVSALFAGVFLVQGRQTVKAKWGLALSEILFFLALILGAADLNVWSVSLSVTLGFFLSYSVCRRFGTAYASLCAVLCGLLIDPIYAPSFLVATLVFGLFLGWQKENVGTFSAAIAASVWAVYMGGIEGMVTFIPASLIAGTVYLFVTVPFQAVPHLREERAVIHKISKNQRSEDTAERFRSISEAYSSLSEVFYSLSDRFRRPGILDLRRIGDSAFEETCEGCPNKSVCWGLEYGKSLDYVNLLISQLHKKGWVEKTEADGSIGRCERMPEILQKINENCSKLTGELLRNNKNEIFAMDYEASAKIIQDALEEDAEEYRFDEESEAKIRDYLKDARIGFSAVTVYGKRRRQIAVHGVKTENARVTDEILREDLGEMCAMEFGLPTYEMEGDSATALLQARPKFSAVGAKQNVSSNGGVSGDSVNLFLNRQDYYYALICDGMGSGKDAAMTSGLCSVFLEKMLRAGNRAGTSLKMLNNMIRSRSHDSREECSSTVDLLELDLMTGKGSFIKSGAAPSFVLRNGTAHRLQSGTAPIGIIRTLDAQVTHVDFAVGDVVVLLSDGVLESDEDGKWLCEYLSHAKNSTPEEIVHHVCLHATGREKHDDCSVIAVKIQRAESGEKSAF